MPQTTILPVFINNALAGHDIYVYGQGTRKQNYLDVRDLTTVVDKLLHQKNTLGVFNVGSKNIISNIDLAKLCIKILKSKSRIIHTQEDTFDEIDWTTSDKRLRTWIGDYQNTSLEQSIFDIAGI